MGSPDIPDPVAPPVLPAIDEVRNIDSLRNRRLKGATLLAGRRTKNEGSLGASILGGIGGGTTVGTGGGSA